MENHLHQMTISFSPQEDRLLLRFGTTGHVEFRLWLTRRIVRQLWEALVKAAESAPDISLQPERRVRRAVMSLRHQAAVQSGDFSQRPDPDAKPHPLNQQPFLVTGIQCSRTAPGKTSLVFNVDNGNDIQLSLDEKLIHALCHLLTSGSAKAEWELDLAIGDPEGMMASSSERLH